MNTFLINDSFHFDKVISVAAQLERSPTEVRAQDLAAAIATVKGSGLPETDKQQYTIAVKAIQAWLNAQAGYSDAYNKEFHIAEHSAMAAIRSLALEQGKRLRDEQVNSFLEHPDTDEFEMCDGLVQMDYVTHVVRSGSVAELVASALPRAEVIANFVRTHLCQGDRLSRLVGLS